MKHFSKSWKSSKKPKKQRKYVHNAPLHLKSKLLNAHLSSDLMKKIGIRSLRVRKGDKVTIARGQFKKKSGKVEKVNVKESTVYVTDISVTKKDGSKGFYPIHASNLIITELVEDKKRLNKGKVNG